MKTKTAFRLVFNTHPILTLNIMRYFKPFYKISFVCAAISNDLIKTLSKGPVSFERLSAIYTKDDSSGDALTAWLQLGIRLNELYSDENGFYSLKGISKKLASSRNEALMAIVQEVVALHHKLILDTPSKLKSGKKWKLDDQDGEIIARSTRMLEPFQLEAIDLTFPKSKPVHLLEVGCGTAFYIKYAANKNPDLSAIGLELQPKVAEMARKNIDKWGLSDRVVIESGDVRDKTPEPAFDIVTLHNNIYYFPVEERVALFSHIKKFLKPNGLLLLTTGCQNGNLPIELVNLWAAATEGCGKLPGADELVNQLKASGYIDIQRIRLIPGDQYYACVGKYV